MKLKSALIVAAIISGMAAFLSLSYQSMQASERRVRNMEALKDALQNLQDMQIAPDCQTSKLQSVVALLHTQAQQSAQQFGALGQTAEFQNHIDQLSQASLWSTPLTNCVEAKAAVQAIDQACKACHQAIRKR